MPADVRDGVSVYTANTQGHPRQHGSWNSDRNRNLLTTMNKDWPGRPLYLQAAISSYFASRQWIQAVRSWVGDDAFWRRAQRYRANQRELDHDLDGAYKISLYSGHWQGQGEPLGGERGPGGSLISLRQAVKHYFQPTFNVGNLRGRSEYRARFEGLIRRMADPNPAGEIAPVPSSQDLQRAMRIVVLRVLDLRGRGLGDPGPDDADMYASVRIAGQPMTSAVIHGHDKYSFPNPNEPFTWIKAVPAVPDEGEPVESVEVEIKTGDVRFAGTNDDVFLRLGRGLRFKLDKRLYDDFERDDRDTYSVPIDDAVRRGMRVGDIREVTIEKAGDGLGGGWRLGGIKLFVNGRPLYSKRNINRWLEDDRRTFTARDFVRSAPRGTKIPVWLRLDEDDLVYGGDDQGDINQFDKRRTVAVGYTPGPPLQRRITGGGRHGGRRDDGDEATITYRLETITPETIRQRQQPPPPPAPAGRAAGPRDHLVLLQHRDRHEPGLGRRRPVPAAGRRCDDERVRIVHGPGPGRVGDPRPVAQLRAVLRRAGRRPVAGGGDRRGEQHQGLRARHLLSLSPQPGRRARAGAAPRRSPCRPCGSRPARRASR